jgi:hypothetical protein
VLWSPAAVGVFIDDGIYLMVAKALAAGEGLRYFGVAGTPPAAKYPPLYPLILGGVWKLSPGFPDNVAYLKAVGVVCTVGAAGVFTWYVTQVLHYPRWFAIGTAALGWLTIDVWRYAVVPLSEPLFLLALILCLAAAARAEAAPYNRVAIVPFLAAFAAAYYTRTAGVVLALAMICSVLFLQRWRVAASLAAGSIFVIMPWLVWSRHAGSRIAPPLADLLGGYGAHLGAQIRLDPAGFLRGSSDRAVAIADRILELLLPTAPYTIRPGLALLVAAVGVAGGIQLWNRSRTVVLTVAGYLAMLVFWPFVGRRLIAPLAPVLVLFVTAGLYDLNRRLVARQPWQVIARATAVVWVCVFALGNGWTLYRGGHDSIHRDRSVLLLRAASAVATHVPRTAIVVSPELWPGIHLYTGRTVAPSTRFRPAATGNRRWGTPQEQVELWLTVGAEYVLLEFGDLVHGETLAFLQQTCGPQAVQLVTRSDAMHLVRLVIDDRCRAALAAARPG